MIIKSVELTNFRNHTHYLIECDDEVSLILGANGWGKTSILEAIYILTRGKSFRATDRDILKRTTDFYRIKLEYQNGTTIIATYDGKNKLFTITDKKSKRLPSKYKYPIILFTPSDLNLISHSPGRRREYFDHIFSQLDESYATSLSKYNKAIKQRNELLKKEPFSPESTFSWNLLLARYGTILATKRQAFISEINSRLTSTYRSIAKNEDEVDIDYTSDALNFTESTYLNTIEQSTTRDIYLGHTSFGIHRDDYLFNLNHRPADTSASRGETRSIIIALKFIEASLIYEQLGVKPVILLDDVFSELDATRRQCLINNFKNHQVIITSVEDVGWIIPCYNTCMIIEKIIPGGQGLATLNDGKKAFFWNALPGEEITEYTIAKQKSHYLEAIATKITHPSPYRIEPRDVCFLSTSPWQIINYDYELQLKQELVVELFREHHIDITTPEIITDGRDYHYRNKMEYALYWDHDTAKINLAFHQRGSHRKIPITKSSIERPEIFTRANQIIDELNHNHDEARRYQLLLLRCNQKGEVSGGLYENHHPHPVFPNLTDTILGHKYSYSPNGFFQINLPVYELALTEIKHHITTDEVLDLYSGVGTIGLSTAHDKHLTLVECDKYAYGELARNITNISELDNTQAVLSKSEEALNYITPNQTVILDPPRSGCDRKLTNKLNEIKPVKIIYLSCNPATQARDVKLLLDNYCIETIKTYNFFPHTPHIENLVIMSRK